MLNNSSFERGRIAFGLMAAGGALAVSGCAHTGNAAIDLSALSAPVHKTLTIEPHAHLRTDPSVVTEDGDGGSNDCYDFTHEVAIPNADVYQQADDSNGTWYGIKRLALTPFIGNVCSYDKDGIVWINEQKIG